MSLLPNNTPGGITIYIEQSSTPTPRQPLSNSHFAMFAENTMGFDILPVSWVTCVSSTSSIQCRSVCLATSRSGYSTSWRCTNSSTSTMQSDYPCLLTTITHQRMSHMRKFRNGNGRGWTKWAGTCLELKPSLYAAEAPLSVPYTIAQLSTLGYYSNSICTLHIKLTMMQK